MKFIAALNTGKWLKIDEEGEATITFKAPARELPEVLKLATLFGKSFIVEIREPNGE